MNNLISVIVPIYKVADYLPKCLDSILNQTYKNLEIILVDDGSPDLSPKICDEYATKDSRIIVIHKMNGGLSSARNAGLEIATGEYIAFVDSDDWLEPDMYRILLDLSVRYDADITECAHKECSGVEYKNEDDKGANGEEICFDGFSAIIKNVVNENVIPDLRFEVWDKLYRRGVISDTRFKVGQIYEDLYFDRMVLKRCNKLVYTCYSGYNYRVNREGSTVTFFNEKKLCKFDEIDEYISEFDSIGECNLAKDFRVFGCASAIDLYYSSKMYGGSIDSRKRILSHFKNYMKKLNPCPKTYYLFAFSPMVYYKIRSIIK